MTPPLEKNMQRLGTSVKALLQMSNGNAAKAAPVGLETGREQSDDVTTSASAIAA
jgi:hypothetical protein